MSSPITPQYCPHKQNPIACWHCLQEQGRRLQADQAARARSNTQGQDPLTDMIARSAPIAPPPPTIRVPPPRGEQATKPSGKMKAPTQMTPEQAAAYAEAQARATDQGPQWTQTASGIMAPPPRRPTVIDQLPSHPEAPVKS
jgi:hypothetical protein